MRTFLLITLFCICWTYHYGDQNKPEDPVLSTFDEELSIPSPSTRTGKDIELYTIDHLIVATEQNLTYQKRLRDFVIQYKDLQKRFTVDVDNKKLAGEMIETAHATISFIKKHHLTHLFHPDFIKELDFFAQFNSDNQISTP